MARDVVREASEEEKAEALAAHPRIGERSPEQRGGEAAVLAELAELNRAYEERFGFRFVVFVNGRSRAEIVPVLRERLQRSRAEELATGCDDLVVDRARPLAEGLDGLGLPRRVGAVPAALAARHRRHRLDRHVVLLRRARQAPAALARRPTAGRGVGDPRRRLLPRREVPRRPRRAAQAAALVQVGGVHDLALRASRCSSSSTTSTRASTSSTRAVANISGWEAVGHEHGAARRRLHRLRGALPAAGRPRAAGSPACWPRPRGGRRPGGQPSSPPRRRTSSWARCSGRSWPRTSCS